MIQSVVIRNFENHKEEIISFKPGFNTIAGKTNRGKSGILRAIKWCCFNTPLGYDFKPFDLKKGETQVSITTKFGKVSRVRGKKRNCYLIGDLEFSALKGEVPDAVKRILPFDKINFQNQFDKFFMLGETPGQVGKELNAVANLEIIDNTVANAQSKERSTKSEITTLEKYKQENEQNLKDLDWVPALHDMKNKVQERIYRFDSLFLQKTTLASYRQKIDTIGEHIYWLDMFLDKKTAVNKIRIMFNDYLDKKDTVKNLTVLKKGLESLTDIDVVIPDLTELLALKDEYEKLSKEINTLENIKASLFYLKRAITQLTKELITDEKLLVKEKAQLNYCQSCGAAKEHWRKQNE